MENEGMESESGNEEGSSRSPTPFELAPATLNQVRRLQITSGSQLHLDCSVVGTPPFPDTIWLKVTLTLKCNLVRLNHYYINWQCLLLLTTIIVLSEREFI